MRVYMRDERGVALLIVFIVTLLLVMLGLSMTFNSLSEFSMANSLENRKHALLVADAGFNVYKDSLRGQNISTILAANTTMPQYISYTEPAGGTDAYDYFIRNPMAPLEAMNVDFSNLPAEIGTRSVSGLLTPAAGEPLGNGRYWAKISDNTNDEAPYGLPDDRSTDQDGVVYLRIMGVQPLGAGQVSTYGSTVKNSVAIIEAKLERDMSFDFSSPFTILAPGVLPNFGGNSFNIDGYDHSGWTTNQITSGHAHPGSSSGSAGIDLLNEPNAAAVRDAVKGAVGKQQEDNIEGPESDYPSNQASIRDNTANVQNSENEDALNLFDPNYVGNFVTRVSVVADFHYLGASTGLSGTNIELGTESSPKITVAEGDLSVSGSGTGVGLMIVKGDLDYSGAFTYRGLILVVGGCITFSGANKSLIGGLFLANLQGPDASGNYSYGDTCFSLEGNSNFYFSGSDIALGYGMLPMRNVVWREITPELEPPF